MRSGIRRSKLKMQPIKNAGVLPRQYMIDPIERGAGVSRYSVNIDHKLMNGWENIHIGTSGWHYRHWKGPFYPQDISKSGFLHYYAERLNTVEVNRSFFRLPSREVLRRWRDAVKTGFIFTIKASRYSTEALAGWAGAFSVWADQGREIFCYFDNDEMAHAVRDAVKLKAMMEKE
jgi:uncharacterized protein YecE (DUF72 family)